MRKLSRSHEEQSILDIWEWYEFQRGLVAAERERAVDGLVGSQPLPELPFGTSIADFFDSQRQDLDDLVQFGLLSAAEAAIRLNYADRVEEKRRDDLSRHFRGFYKRRGYRVELDEVILHGWRRYEPQAKNSVDDFGRALGLRDWLAHGRFWSPKWGRTYTADDVYDLCYRTLTDMHLL